MRRDRAGDILILTLDNPPINAITAAVRAGLWAALDAAEADAGVAAIVLRAAGPNFSAGGDLKEVGRPDAPGSVPLTALNDRVEGFARPVVVPIQGRAYGGGVLLAMAAAARIGTAEARLLLPEVRLGFVPGAGGTQRLPRLCGMLPALEMVALAQEMPAARALRLGLLDTVAEGDPVPAAMDLARAIAAGRHPWRRTRALPAPAAAPPEAVAALRDRVAAAFPGREAPEAAIALIQGAAEWPFAEGAARERATYERLAAGPQAAALLHLFFAERAIRLPEGVSHGTGACRLLRHPGTRVAELLAEADASPDAIAAARATAKRERLLPVPVRGPVVARLRAAMGGMAALDACRAEARACLAEGLAEAGAIDILAVEACSYPAHLGGPLHHDARG